MDKSTPYQPTDESARSAACGLITQATYASLAFLRQGTAVPSVSRIAVATDEHGCPVSLVSNLADHTRALLANPACALLIGEPAGKGDPLTHPRLSLHATAQQVERNTPEHKTLRARYLSLRPKARLYVDFTDFMFVRFDVSDGVLNGGFGKAYRLTASDLQRTT